MLSGLRYFEHALKDNGRGQSKQAFSWGAVDMASVARCFMELCSKAEDVFSSEPRLLEVNSPTYVLGKNQLFHGIQWPIKDTVNERRLCIGDTLQSTNL